MRGLNLFLGLLFLIAAVTSFADESGTIAGRINYEGDQAGAVIVRCYRLHVTSDGEVRRNAFTLRPVEGDFPDRHTVETEDL